jgi:ComF family protein
MGSGTDPRGVGVAGRAARSGLAWLAGALDGLVGDRCLACGEAVARPAGRPWRLPVGWCEGCAGRVVALGAAFCLDCGGGEGRRRCARPGHLRLTAAVQYGPEVAALVGAVKYRRVPEVLGVWGEAWDAAVGIAGAERVRRPDLLVAVPAHAARVRERGLDVTAEWARRLGERAGVPTARALVRRRATPPQVGRDRERRRVNVAGAFGPGPEAAAAAGRRVALVDDVVTTGATLGECAAVLCALGAAEVAGWALAYEPLE